MGVIYLVRHGQASFGSGDYDRLSTLGQEQSRHLGAWIDLCKLNVSAITTGSQNRHLQTAIACTGSLGDSRHQDSGFNEFDHMEVLARYRPDLASSEDLNEFLSRAANPHRTFQEVFSRAIARWVGGAYDPDYAESYAAFLDRVKAALLRVIETAASGENIWVFTSGGPITAIVQDVLGITDVGRFDLNWTMVNTGVSKLLFSHDRISVSYLNNHSHLERLQRPELITYI